MGFLSSFIRSFMTPASQNARTDSPQAQLAQTDPVLAEIIETIDLPPLPESKGLYYDLVSCVLDQQIPARSRGVYVRKLKNILDSETILPVDVAFLEEESFVDHKIARPKFATLQRITQHWQAQHWEEMDWSPLSDEEVRAALSEIKGVGPWTVETLLIYSLGREDAFPVDDYHLKQIMGTLYGIEPGNGQKRRMKDMAEAWRPERSRA
ncbi:MAG: hypothetical protein AAFP02_04590, partial [Bacteroidota bacterium]